MATNLVKFVYVPNTVTADQIAAFDANTIYFVGATGSGKGGKLYKGSRLYDAGAEGAIADIAALEAYVGEIPSGATATDIVGYIEEAVAAGVVTAEAYTDTLDNSLAAVAKSGTASDVAVVDSGNVFNSTNVEDALGELNTKIDNATTAGAVTLESASGSGDTLTVYSLYQGVTLQDSAAQKAAKKIGDINIPKDYLVKSAVIEVVETADTPYAGALVGDKYIDFVINTQDTADGTGTEQHIYIALNDLVAVMDGSEGTEITVDIDSHNVISATVNTISGDKVIYEVGTGGANDITVNDKLDALEQALGDGIDALDGSATIATVSNGVVTLKGGISEVNGVIDNDNSADIVLAKVATTGAAIDVSYGQSSTVKAALDTIGTIPGTSEATTVVGYVDEQVSAGVAALDADVDATLGAGDTDPEAVAAVAGVTEVDGVVTSVDSVAVDAAGAATRAKAAVIGSSNDVASASTIYGAKAYADAAVGTAVSALDADLDAALTVSDTDTNAVAVVTGVTEVDGVITGIDSVAVDRAGAATTAEANAKSYTDTCLQWGSLA